jgi:hypothetical protein
MLTIDDPAPPPPTGDRRVHQRPERGDARASITATLRIPKVPRVFCVRWTEDDEVLGERHVGCSLHLSRTDAASYVKTRAARFDGCSQPFCVDVPDTVLESVRATANGLFWATPCECPWPVVKEHADSSYVEAGARQLAS